MNHVLLIPTSVKKVFAAVAIATLLASALPVGVMTAFAATIHSTASVTVSTAAPFASGAIDASNHENLELSFNYDAEELDSGDSFTYGWRQVAGGNNDLGTINGANEVGTTTPTDEVSSVTVSLPVGAEISDLEVYITVASNSGGDVVDVTNLAVNGDEVTLPGTITTEEFVTVDGSYKGISVGFRTEDFGTASAVTVTLERADGSTVVKTANQGVLDIINQDTVGGDQLTAPFVIQEGTFTEAGDTTYWNPAPASWDTNTTPVKVTIEVTDENGTVTAINNIFNEGAPSWPTYVSLLPASVTGVTPPTVPALSGEVIFDTIPSVLPSNYPSQGFQATQTYELGDKITFEADTNRELVSAAVTLSSWACETGEWQNGNCDTTPGATFDHPITLNLYEVAMDGSVGALIHSVTNTYSIPFRPSADAACADPKQWMDTNGDCFNGYNHVVVFDLTGVTVPDTIIFGVAYNTQTYGDAPIGSEGPYDALNVSLNTDAGAPYVGTDVNSDEVFIDSTFPGSTAGFRAETGWSPYKPAVTFTSVPPAPKTTNTVVVTGDTAAGENQPGWLFNRDTSTATPFEFNEDKASIGDGALYVLPIGSTNAADKFVAEYFALAQMSDVDSFSYDFNLGSNATSTDYNEFYLNVYANFGVSSSTKFYDCRYNVIPTSGTVGGWTTVTFDPSLTYGVTQHGTSPAACPSSPAAMGADAVIRAFAINVGDSSLNDAGVDGYLDRVVFETDTNVTTFDFELEAEDSDDDDDRGSSSSGGRSNRNNDGGPTPQVLGAMTDEEMLELLEAIERRLLELLVESYATPTVPAPVVSGAVTPTVTTPAEDEEEDEGDTATSTPEVVEEDEGDTTMAGIVDDAERWYPWLLVAFWLLATGGALWYRNSHPETMAVRGVQVAFGSLAVVLVIAALAAGLSFFLWPALIVALGAFALYFWSPEV